MKLAQFSQVTLTYSIGTTLISDQYHVHFLLLLLEAIFQVLVNVVINDFCCCQI